MLTTLFADAYYRQWCQSSLSTVLIIQLSEKCWYSQWNTYSAKCFKGVSITTVHEQWMQCPGGTLHRKPFDPFWIKTL